MNPRISVVIPTYRRPLLLARCLTALCEQTLSREDYEIVVVSDGPDETSEQLVAGMAARSHARLRWFALDRRRGPAAARNFGWRAAHADIIAFTDDDTVPARAWLASGIATFSGEDIAAAWGRTVVPLPDVPTDYETDAARLSHAGFVTANSFCRRSALESVGGFDERFTRAWREDSDLLFSLMSHGLDIAHAPNAMVLHPLRPARWGVSLLQQRKAQFNALLYKKHRSLYRQFVQPMPPWRYYATIFSLLLAWYSVAFSLNMTALALAAWIVLTGNFCVQRLTGTSHNIVHVFEMIITSVLIPPLAVTWRLYGAVKYRVFFL